MSFRLTGTCLCTTSLCCQGTLCLSHYSIVIWGLLISLSMVYFSWLCSFTYYLAHSRHSINVKSKKEWKNERRKEVWKSGRKAAPLSERDTLGKGKIIFLSIHVVNKGPPARQTDKQWQAVQDRWCNQDTCTLPAVQEVPVQGWEHGLIVAAEKQSQTPLFSIISIKW